MAEANVDAIGVTELVDATSPEEVRVNPPLAPSELGIAVGNAQSDAYYEALSDCVDPRRRLTASMGDAEADCFNQSINDEFIRELAVALFTSAAEISPELDAALTDVAEDCPRELTATQPQPGLERLAGVRNLQAAAASVKVISYNVRGLLRAAVPTFFVDGDMTRFTELVGDEVHRWGADFVLLQEICGSQAELIARRSSLLGHPMSVIAVDPFPPSADRYDDAVRLCPGGHPDPGTPIPYGRAILATNPSATPIAPPNGVGAQCIRAESPGLMRVCNLHASEGDTSIPGPFEQWAQSEPWILGGDFNTTPAHEPMPSLYGYMHEADSISCDPDGLPVPGRIRSEGLCYRPTVPAGPAPYYKKIDYVLADKAHFGEALPSEVLPMRCHRWRYCSDHQMLAGGFTLTAAAPGSPQAGDGTATGDFENGTYELDCFSLPPTAYEETPRSAPSGSGPTQPYTLTDGQYLSSDDALREVSMQLVKVEFGDFDGDGATEAAALIQCRGISDHIEENDFLFAFDDTPQGWRPVGYPLTAAYIIRDGSRFVSYDVLNAPEDRLYKRTMWTFDPSLGFVPVAHGPNITHDQLPQDPERLPGPP